MNKHGACPSHCCPVHGCAYGYQDCPVSSGDTLPVYLPDNGCERCEYDRENAAPSVAIIDEMIEDAKQRAAKSSSSDVLESAGRELGAFIRLGVLHEVRERLLGGPPPRRLTDQEAQQLARRLARQLFDNDHPE